MNSQLEVEVFRAGDYGAKGVWGEGELERIASDYDPALHEAPVTLDHAQQGPALGWVEALRRVGDRLVARLRGLNGRLVELIREGSFKKRSVEIYPALRETGRPYLRAVSFLGASVPEVKGLADPLPPLACAEGTDNTPNSPNSTDPTDRSDQSMPSIPSIPSSTTPAAQPCLVFEETPEAIHEGGAPAPDDANAVEQSYQPAPETQTPTEADAPAETDTSMPAEAAATPHPAVPFAEVSIHLRQAGKWRPAWAGCGIEPFYNSLAGLNSIEVADGQSIPAPEWFAAFLESLPPVVSMGEEAPSTRFAEEGFAYGAAPIDQASLTLHRAVVAYQQANPGTSYAEALAHCAATRRA